jgi:hypothetical protein
LSGSACRFSSVLWKFSSIPQDSTSFSSIIS